MIAFPIGPTIKNTNIIEALKSAKIAEHIGHISINNSIAEICFTDEQSYNTAVSSKIQMGGKTVNL